MDPLESFIKTGIWFSSLLCLVMPGTCLAHTRCSANIRSVLNEYKRMQELSQSAPLREPSRLTAILGLELEGLERNGEAACGWGGRH